MPVKIMEFPRSRSLTPSAPNIIIVQSKKSQTERNFRVFRKN